MAGFGRSSRGKNGLHSQCRVCLAAYKRGLCSTVERNVKRRAHNQANPGKVAAWNRKRKFGMSQERYEAMLRTQGGVCRICRQSEKAMRRGRVMSLAVDHDHATGAIRSLLCLNCNRAIGALKDDFVLAARAAAYLEGAA